jgi:uncharacterized damage-inducible protein DinB
MKKLIAVSVLCLAPIAFAVAQTGQPGAKGNPLVDGVRMDYTMVKAYVTKASEQVPDKLYGFQPTPEVRTVAQLFGHIADANYEFCAAATGARPPVRGIEKSKSAKEDIVKAVGESFAYCDKAFASMTDADAAKMVDFGSPTARLSIMAMNTSHDNLHDGNIVTYMRPNKIVPPSSQPPR